MTFYLDIYSEDFFSNLWTESQLKIIVFGLATDDKLISM